MDFSVKRLQEWAYNTDDVLLEQDEDLLLHEYQYVAVLFTFVDDIDCPKGEYCKNILEYYFQELFLNRNINVLLKIDKLVDNCTANIERTRKLISKFKTLLQYLTTGSEITDDAADYIARELINGDCCKREIKKTGRLVDNAIEYVGYTGSFKLFLYINRANCMWRFSNYKPLQRIE